MNLKVIVTGAFSTGKTTLVDVLGPALRARGLSVETLPDVARSCPYPLNKGQNDAASVWLATTQVSSELSAAARAPDLVICDRGVPDILAHQEDLRASGQGAALELMRPFLESWCRTYDLVLAAEVDPSIPPEVDGLRLADEDYRMRLASCADAVLERFCSPVRLVNDPAARLAQALDAIRARSASADLASASVT